MTTEQFAFRDGFNGLRDGFATDRDAAKASFSATSQQIASLHSRVNTRNFFLDVDEPEVLGGTDKGSNPVGLVLATLASRQEITYRLCADRLGLPLNGVSVHLEGDIDLSGFTAADDGVRPGFAAIRGSVDIDRPAPLEKLEELKATVDRHCPVLDIIGGETPVSLEMTPAAVHDFGGGVAADGGGACCPHLFSSTPTRKGSRHHDREPKPGNHRPARRLPQRRDHQRGRRADLSDDILPVRQY